MVVRVLCAIVIVGFKSRFINPASFMGKGKLRDAGRIFDCGLVVGAGTWIWTWIWIWAVAWLGRWEESWSERRGDSLAAKGDAIACFGAPN